ncbi:hypothetical protein GGX14DRAFT_575809 [Mycena pura]|uniref:Cyanovirin-N domain-containing protein n=1 Tax=Mycena pura TaxID=153505 RepID=A0AAD6V1K1_9AGAR|nr:hypothetical protein GGX14DRAFT_575809 [Mycena pura]
MRFSNSKLVFAVTYLAIVGSGNPISNSTTTSVPDLPAKPQVTPTPLNGAGATCHGWQLGTDTVSATCGNGVGGEVTSTVSLNSCIANVNGVLVCSVGGDAAHSCSFTFMVVPDDADTVGLVGDCTNASGQSVSAGIDLNMCITNRGGFLSCP